MCSPGQRCARGVGCPRTAVRSTASWFPGGGVPSESVGTVIGRSQYGQSVTRPPRDPAARNSSPQSGQVKVIWGRGSSMIQPRTGENAMPPTIMQSACPQRVNYMLGAKTGTGNPSVRRRSPRREDPLGLRWKLAILGKDVDRLCGSVVFLTLHRTERVEASGLEHCTGNRRMASGSR